jgi:hypothetical protein
LSGDEPLASATYCEYQSFNMASSSNIGSNKRTTTHLVFAFLVSMALKQQCQATAFNKRNLNNNGATAFIVPSSPLSATATTKRSIIHERLNDRQRVSSLSMSFLDTTSSLIATTLQDQSTQQLLDTTTTTQQITNETGAPIIIEQLSPTTTLIVFIIGIIPFIWATIEFWRRIAVGASFGTTADSVVIPSPFDTDDSSGGGNDKMITIGEDNNPMSSRGRQTLDRGALTVAYVLFGVAAFTVGIAVASVVMGPKPP